MESLAYQYKRIAATIAYYASLYGYTEEELATIAHMSRTTWWTRKQRPETFTISELGMLAHKFGVAIEKLVGGEP